MQFQTKLGLVDVPNDQVLAAADAIRGPVSDIDAQRTPNAKLPPLVPDGPRRAMLVEIKVGANFEKRLDNQWEVEREIHADRWNWHWAKP
jgi:hypothetical protein